MKTYKSNIIVQGIASLDRTRKSMTTGEPVGKKVHLYGHYFKRVLNLAISAKCPNFANLSTRQQ